MVRALFLVLALLASSLSAQEYSFPSASQPATGTWQAAGVTGGIPTRETIYVTITSTGDSTDRTSAINSELSSCTNGQTVLLGPGTFRINGTINIPFGKQITLRGSVDSNGVPTTILDARAEEAISTTWFDFSSGNTTVTPSTLTKGATTITVASTAGFSPGELIRIRMGDIADPPTYSLNTNEEVRGQVAKIADVGGVPNSTTLVIDAPGLHGDYSGAPSATVRSMSVKTSNCGIENLIIDGSNGTLKYGVRIQSAYNCWVKNVRVFDYYNYAAYVTYSYKVEFRRCWFEFENGYATSTVGMLVDSTSLLLVEDNVFKDGIFAFFTQGFVSGAVLGYNAFVTNRPDLTPQRFTSLMNVNHAPFNQFILIEGNVAHEYKNDGYFGGTAYNTVFRNWLFGLELGQTAWGAAAVMNRFSRYENLVGNVFGHGSSDGTGVSTGNPNINNGNSSGVASMFGTKATLASRASATSGTITAPSGHGITTGSTIDVYWMEVINTYNTARIRRDVTVGTVSGTSIPFSGGEGNDLPGEGEQVLVPTSNSALWAYSLDWDSALQRPRVWTGSLLSRTSDTAGVVRLDGGQVASFNAALANTGFNQRHFAYSGSSGGTAYVSGVSGDDVTIYSYSDNPPGLPAEGTSISIYASNDGFQELDLDVLLKTTLKGNYYHQPTGAGIPAVESLGGATLPSSLYLSATPQSFVEAGMTWPPISTASPPSASYEVIPAGKAYVDGYWPADSSTVATPTFTPAAGTLAAGTAVSIGGATSGATYYYTTNGDTPTISSTLYTGPISLSVGTTVLKAIGVKAELTDSAVAVGTFTLVNVPTAPSSLSATATSSSQINLAWSDNSDNETGFRLERRIGVGSWGTVTTTAANATSYSNTGLTPATTYEYRVYAVNVAGDSTASNTDSATTNSEGGGGGAANATIQTLNVGTLNIQ